jgi:allophanate hydrolase subunit 2
LEFKAATKLVLTGAEISPKLNHKSIQNYKIYTVCAGDILSFGALLKGARCYLAVADGFQTPTVLNSRSFYEGITLKGILLKRDEVSFKSFNEKKNNLGGILNNKKQFYETSIVEVYKGPEFELFSLEEQEKLKSTKYTVSNQSNRMGYRLEETVVANNKSIITSPVIPGTVQIVPSGQLIVLMKDAQTTGGYPRVFQLTEKSIAILAQKKAGDKFNFLLVSP